MEDVPLQFSEDQLVPAKELNRRSGQCLERAQEKDLLILREGRAVAALVGYQRYRRLRQIENAWEEIAMILESKRRLREYAHTPAQTYSLDEVLAENGLADDDKMED